VAKKYQKDPNAVTYLTEKIIKGGSGVWGEASMAAHPNLRDVEAKQIVTWIQSLASQAQPVKSLPQSGSVDPTLKQPVKDRGILYLSATYTDKGGNNIKPLTGNYTITLRNNKMTFTRVRNMNGFTKANARGFAVMAVPKNSGWFSIDDIDLTNITGADFSIAWQKPSSVGYTFEIRLDSQDGTKLGEFSLPAGGATASEKTPVIETKLSSKLEAVNDGKLHKLFIVSKSKEAKDTGQVGIQWVEFKSK